MLPEWKRCGPKQQCIQSAADAKKSGKTTIKNFVTFGYSGRNIATEYRACRPRQNLHSKQGWIVFQYLRQNAGYLLFGYLRKIMCRHYIENDWESQ